VVIVAVAFIALAWLFSRLVKLALSGSREFLADAGSVELIKNPDAMISALRKIENRGELPGATSAVMELCVDNPREGFADLFATHRSADARVQALVKYAGGHDPGRLALRVETAEQRDDRPPEPVNGQTPPRLPQGPWSDALDPSEGSQSGPWSNPSAPWRNTHRARGFGACIPAGTGNNKPAGLTQPACNEQDQFNTV
jgi:heat shock protein HtpX